MRKLKKPFISLDVDSVLLSLEDKIFDYIEEVYGDRITTMDVDHWEYYGEHYPKVFEMFKEPNLYDDVPAIQEMIPVVEKLINKYGANAIQIITSSHPNVAESKERALMKFFGHIKGFDRINVIHVGLKGDDKGCHHKHDYTNGTILVDDALHNQQDHIEKNKTDKDFVFEGKENKNIGLLVDFNYGWNQDEKTIKEHIDNNEIARVKSANEITKKIDNIISNNFTMLPEEKKVSQTIGLNR